MNFNNNHTQQIQTGDLYGKYSFGNIYEKLFSEEYLQRIKEVVTDDLQIAGLNDRINKLKIMDVGTGRQALAFGLLNAQKVDHFDISEQHVSRFKARLEKRYPHLPITSKQMDLVESPPPVKAYDLVYLSGIAHHFSNTQKGLINCAQAVKIGGRIWVYFYRSGTFKWMVCQMIRSLVKPEEIDLFFYSSALIYANGNLQNDNTSLLMDDLFVPYIHLYPPHDYITFFNKCGFEICGSSHCDPISYVNHQLAHHSAVIVFERKRDVCLNGVGLDNILTPETSVDQMDESLYGDEQTREVIRKFGIVRDNLLVKDCPVFRTCLCLSLHKAAAPQYYGSEEFPPAIEEVSSIIDKGIEYLESH